MWFLCVVRRGHDTSGVFFAEVLSLEARLSCCPQCWLSSVLSVQGCSSWVMGAAAHLPRSAWNIPLLLLFLLRSSCSSSRLVKVICHPAVRQSYGWTTLDFSPGCHVDLEIAAVFCIMGGFFVPYLPVWGIVEQWWKELHTIRSYHLRFCSSASVVTSEDSWHYLEHLNWRCGLENSFFPSVKPPEQRGKVDACGLMIDSVFLVWVLGLTILW